MTVTAVVLTSVAGILLSIILQFFPKVAAWYNALTDPQQKGIVILLAIVVGAGALALSCVGWLILMFPGIVMSCTQANALSLLASILITFFSSQVTFLALFQKKPIAG